MINKENKVVKIHDLIHGIPIFESALLEQTPPLLELRLVNCKILPLECKLIPLLHSVHALRILDLSCNSVRLLGLLLLLTPKDKEAFKALRDLILVHCGISDHHLEKIPLGLLQKPKAKFTLEALNISYNSIGSLARMLTEDLMGPTLKKLQMVQCKLGNDFAKAFCAKIPSLKALQQIDISYNIGLTDFSLIHSCL